MLSKSPMDVAFSKPLLKQLKRYIAGRSPGEPDPLYTAGRISAKRVLIVLVNEYPEIVLEIEKKITQES